ncbi:MAG: GNAT family N-acetyltransferase [Gemmatimonadaceae bacterium]
MTVPVELRTGRLVLRPWRAADAPILHPILRANAAHLGPWIPARVAEPVPVPELEDRLAGFAADFLADREWRYALRASDDGDLLGEVGLYPRSGAGRVRYADADRVEIGYWLRRDATGSGLATEAARAMLAVASGLPGLTHLEIRCDARNVRSAAVPRRLGFVLSTTIRELPATPAEPVVELQLWTHAIR